MQKTSGSYTLRDMFDVPLSMGAIVTLRFHTMQWGWITAKGVVDGQNGDRINVKIIEYSRSTPADPNLRPTHFTPAANAVIVIGQGNQ